MREKISAGSAKAGVYWELEVGLPIVTLFTCDTIVRGKKKHRDAVLSSKSHLFSLPQAHRQLEYRGRNPSLLQ